MSASIIDLPEHLQPRSLLRYLDNILPSPSRQIVDSCKEIVNYGDRDQVSGFTQEVNKWWKDSRDTIGASVASLWQADFFWRNWATLQNEEELGNVIEYCNNASGYKPGPAAATSSYGVDIVQNESARLRQVLAEKFSDSELRDICHDLKIDYETLPTQHKGDFARELVSFCERHGRISELLELCRKQRRDIDWEDIHGTSLSSSSVLAIVSALTEATNHYMFGLSNQMLNNRAKASRSYVDTIKSINVAKDRWLRTMYVEEKAFEQLLEWLRTLTQYTKSRSAPTSGMMLLWPWQHGDKSYLIAEMPLVEPICVEGIQGHTATAIFLLERQKPWLWIQGKQINGYKVKAEECIWIYGEQSPQCLAFNPPTSNLDALYEDHLVLPSGATYHAFKVDKQPPPFSTGSEVGECLVACNPIIPVPELFYLVHRKVDYNETLVFERDSTNRVHFKEVGDAPPPRYIGRLDFALRLPEPNEPPSVSGPQVHVLGGQ